MHVHPACAAAHICMRVAAAHAARMRALSPSAPLIVHAHAKAHVHARRAACAKPRACARAYQSVPSNGAQAHAACCARTRAVLAHAACLRAHCPFAPARRACARSPRARTPS
eukprot:5768004-Pleurochrysis_carterae.AAC.1